MDIKTEILGLAFIRGIDKTFCPSEVARNITSENWRDLMPEIRRISDELVVKQHLEVLQKGKIISSAVDAIGPIRLRLKTKSK